MPSDLDKLQGTWTITSLELDGQRMPSAVLDDSWITIEGSGFASAGMGDSFEGTVDLDEKKKPKTFDLIFAGTRSGVRNFGIYELEGDTWTICLATLGDKRPRRFATKPGTGYALETLQRAAAATTRKLRKTSSKSARSSRSLVNVSFNEEFGASGPATELEGEWVMVSGVLNGAAMDQSAVEWCKRFTRGNITRVVAGPQEFLNANFTLDVTQNPHAIDYKNLSGPNKGKVQAGIFELAGDELSICVSAPGKPRPKDFSSKPKDGRSYTTWRLIKK